MSSTSDIVIDTNVVLDAWVFADLAAQPLREALEAGQLRWLCTAAMADELADVLTRPLPPRWDAARQQAAGVDFDARRTRVAAAEPPPAQRLACSDPDDQKFIDLALAHRCRWLFTRDRALLRLAGAARRQGVTVLRPADWTPEPPPDEPRYQAAGSFLRSSNSLSGRCAT